MSKRNGQGLTAAQIRLALFGKDGVPLQPRMVRVETPEWEERGIPHVFVRMLNAAAWSKLQDMGSSIKDRKASEIETMVRMCAMCMCDHAGTLLFSEADSESLMQMEVTPFMRASGVLMDVNGLTQESVKNARKK